MTKSDHWGYLVLVLLSLSRLLYLLKLWPSQPSWLAFLALGLLAQPTYLAFYYVIDICLNYFLSQPIRPLCLSLLFCLILCHLFNLIRCSSFDISEATTIDINNNMCATMVHEFHINDKMCVAMLRDFDINENTNSSIVYLVLLVFCCQNLKSIHFVIFLKLS